MEKKSKSRKSWREKFENPAKGLPKVVSGPAKWKKSFGGTKVLVPTPRLVNEQIRKIPKGKVATVNLIRERLSKNFKAESTCPLTTGIFLRIISEVAEEDRRSGKKRITPYWRVLKADGSLNPKYPGGVKAQAAQLKKEGHCITQAGKKSRRVKNFENRLFKL